MLSLEANINKWRDNDFGSNFIPHTPFPSFRNSLSLSLISFNNQCTTKSPNIENRGETREWLEGREREREIEIKRYMWKR
jgi:hypothetical protein